MGKGKGKEKRVGRVVYGSDVFEMQIRRRPFSLCNVDKATSKGHWSIRNIYLAPSLLMML